MLIIVVREQEVNDCEEPHHGDHDGGDDGVMISADHRDHAVEKEKSLRGGSG